MQITCYNYINWHDIYIIISIRQFKTDINYRKNSKNAGTRTKINEPPHYKSNKVTLAPSEDSDQLGHPPSLIRGLAVRSVGS